MLIEWDFEHTLHYDLSKVMFDRSWRWFTLRIAGLLSQRGTALNAYFHPSDDSRTSAEGAPDGQ